MTGVGLKNEVVQLASGDYFSSYDFNLMCWRHSGVVFFRKTEEGNGEVIYSDNPIREVGQICKCLWSEEVGGRPVFVEVTPEEGEEFKWAGRQLRVEEVRKNKIIYSSLETGLEYHSSVPDFLLLEATRKSRELKEDRNMIEMFGWEK